MTQVTCARCGNTAVGLDSSPFPGATGELVHQRICAICWAEWMAMQVKVINENRLTPARPEHFEFLTAQLKTFLNLREG